MRQLSDRIARIPLSVTMAVHNKALAMKRSGKAVVDLSAGEPDFPSPDHVKEAGIEAIRNDRTHYTALDGIPELKEAICQKLHRDNGLDYTPEEIIVNCGAKHSLYATLQCLINPGDDVIIPVPYCASYPSQVMLAGGNPVFVPTTIENDFKLTPELLEAALTPAAKALILNSPSNPTGGVYVREEIEALGRVIVRHQLQVISDEIYERITYDGATACSPAAINDQLKELTVVVNGCSKAYAMTGWRIGYSAGPKFIIDGIKRLQSHETSNAATISQHAAITAILNSAEDVRRMVEEFDRRRRFLLAAFDTLPAIQLSKPAGAFYLFPDVSAYYGKRFNGNPINDSLSLCEFLLDTMELALVPGAGFGEDRCIRVSYAVDFETLKDVARLRRIYLWYDHKQCQTGEYLATERRWISQMCVGDNSNTPFESLIAM